jgi:hypothetical protein
MKKPNKLTSEENLHTVIAEVGYAIETAKPRRERPQSTIFPRQSPEFTEREWLCLAWIVASLAWIPDRWTTEVGSIAKKLRMALGDDAMQVTARPPEDK